jgi:TorA-specific chaperone
MSALMPAALTATAWQQACQQRAAVYGWFSSLYASELPAATLAAYEAGELTTLLEGLCRIGLEKPCQRVQLAFDSLLGVPHAHLELAADFAHTFLLDAKAGALPYASCYTGKSEEFFGEAEQRMRAFLAQSSLALQDEFKEPADHLAIYLAVMVKLIEQAGTSAMPVTVQALDQAAFLKDGLMDWLALFVDKCQQVGTRYDVYPALASLLLAFVQQDQSFLQDVAQGEAVA